MIRLAATAIATAIALQFATPALAAGTSAPGKSSDWQWSGRSGDVRPLVVKLVRGSAVVVRRPGPAFVAVAAFSSSGQSSLVQFDVSEGADAVVVSDRYPGGVRNWKECVPAGSPRGEFWASDVRMRATVFAPEGQAVRIEFMERDSG